MNLNELTERGLRELLAGIREARVPLKVRLDAAEREAALLESAANSLRKIGGYLDVLEAALIGRLNEIQSP